MSERNDTEGPAFWAVFVIAAIIGLGFLGLIAWAIVRIVTHFT